MNKKEKLKVAIMGCCINETMTIKLVAERLNFSERYVKKCFEYLFKKLYAFIR